MKKLLPRAIDLGILVAILLVSFTATALAADAATGDDPGLADLLRPVYEAFASGHYVAAGALAVVLGVALLKRYAPGRVGSFVNGDAGGALATLVVSFAGTIAAYTGGDQPWAWSMAWRAGGIAFAAAGGYALIKKLLVAPLLASAWYRERAPAWLRAALGAVLWIFDRPAASAQVITEAEKAGDAAVAASPSPGVEKIAGKPETF